MKIHEYQAKAVLARHGVPVPEGEVATTPAEVAEIAARLGGRVVVKAQIHAGGRGKGGGVKVAGSVEEAARIAETILGMQLVTPQTGPEGRLVSRVLVEQGLDVARELYLGMVIDRSRRCPILMASPDGGMDIEEVAARTPERIFQEPIHPATGLTAFQGRKLAFALGFEGSEVQAASALMAAMYETFLQEDASLVEINPLVLTGAGRILALDAKISIDDSALARHPDLRELRDLSEEDPLEVEASKYALNYIRLDGSIGCMVNGAGLAMATMDIIKLEGGDPANFLDVGGGANAEQIRNAFKILMSDAHVRAVLINVFGGILRCDVLAQGVVAAVQELGVRVPIVVRMEGTNVAEGKRILVDSGLNFTTADSMGEAAKRVVALSREA